jgi:hypothetical protein
MPERSTAKRTASESRRAARCGWALLAPVVFEVVEERSDQQRAQILDPHGARQRRSLAQRSARR